MNSKKFFSLHQFDYVIICAAIADVEKCYLDQILSYQVNVTGTLELLNIAKTCKTIPIFFSSDYVFSGKETPYCETDIPNPLTIYGKQKLAVEKFIQENFNEYLIFRTSKLMSKTNHPKNILLPILNNLKMKMPSHLFMDQLLNPVLTEDIAQVITKSIDKRLSGLYHLGTKRCFNRAELGKFIAMTINSDVDLIKSTRMKEMIFPEKRPSNNSLKCNKIENDLNFNFSEIADIILKLNSNL